ncbi:MAG: glycosyltransferase family 2 protein [Candidatus Falkowbacteria bacterium]|nr:glycosyltransferase family 2 protein [Candidatus Falkowbacteria bacterium]
MDISIVIVNYKNKGLTLNCIRSVEESALNNLKHEIIVVDNNSDDNIGQILAWQYPKVIFIENKSNVGMGAGNNVGLKRARGKYVVVMNPDTFAFPDTLAKLFVFMEANPSVGVVGPKQYNPDKTIQDSCYRWHSFFTPFFRRTFLGRSGFAKQEIDRYLMQDYDKKTIREVDWLLGSCLFMRAKALKEIGWFDERFFLYFEDTDLCRRFWDKKWHVVYNPEVEIIHNHNRESAREPWYTWFMNSASRQHLKSWWLYMLKWAFRTPESR